MSVKINQSIDHIVNFEAHAGRVPAEFIVESVGEISLLTFNRSYHNSDLVYIFQATDDEYGLFMEQCRIESAWKSEERSDLREYVVKVAFSDSEPGRSSRSQGKDDECFDISWDANTDTLNFCPDETGVCHRVRIDFHLKFKERTYMQSVVVNVVPKEMIFDAVIDFGSEASQIFKFRRHHATIVDDMFPIYSGFKELLGSPRDDDANVLQFEQGNPYMYKSHFFIPRIIDANRRYDPAKGPQDIELLKQYTLIDQLPVIRSEYVTLPNVKIAAYGGVKAPEVKSSNGQAISVKTFQNKYFYRALVNSFVYQILSSIADEMLETFEPQESKYAYLVLYALVPNIYTQAEVSDYLANLRADMKKIIESDGRMNSVIKGFCITSVSESDASFLGFLSACPAQANILKSGEYLIMDAGKGTLDFSVIDYDIHRAPSIKGVYRSGIVGAGNALTYAFFLAVLSQIYSQTVPDQAQRDKRINEFVKDKVHNGDEAEVYAMMDLLECYKRKYNEGVLNGEWIGGTMQRNAEFELSGLINLLQMNLQNNSALSDYSIVDAMMEKIADNAVRKLACRGQNNIEKVIFTGRGFRLKAFKEVMLEKLRNLDGCADLEEICIDEDAVSMKMICLLGLPYLNYGKYDGLMVGEPDILHHGDDILTKHLAHVEKTNKSKKKGQGVCTSIGKLTKYVSMIFSEGGDGGSMDQDLTVSVDNNYVNGVQLRAISGEDKVVISGNFYGLANLHAGNFDVFFDGDNFLARQDRKILQFGPVVDVERRMAYESMFPYAEYADSTIPIPHPVAAGDAPVARVSPTPVDNKGETDTAKDITDEELARKLTEGK